MQHRAMLSGSQATPAPREHRDWRPGVDGAGLRDALRAFDPSLLDEDAERSLCRECCQRVHDQGADPDAAGALHVAVALKSPRLVACLVDDCGADPNHRFDGARGERRGKSEAGLRGDAPVHDCSRHSGGMS